MTDFPRAMRILSFRPAQIQIFADAALSRAAADEFSRAALEAIRARGRFSVALAGGSTPKEIYSLIATDESTSPGKLLWKQVHVFFGDERCVAPDHVESNFRMADEALLSRVPVPAANVHRIRAELGPEAGASAYEAELRACFALTGAELPRFDLIMLGLGADGHTASLFPGTAALEENSRLVCANFVPKLNTNRITLTLPVLNDAAEILFAATGAEKARVLREVLRPEPGGPPPPAARVRPRNGRLLWMIDQSAAAYLPDR